MNPQPHEFRHDLPLSGITHQRSDSHLRREIDQRFADESLFIQRKERNKLFVSSWTHLLGVAFTSLAAAYFLLLCFRLIESARQWAPPTRSLAARRGESCYSGSGSGNADEGGTGPTGDSAEGLELEGFGDGGLLLHPEVFGSQGAAEGTQEVDVGFASYFDISEDVAGFNPNQAEDADLHLWEGRNMPVEQEQRLRSLFGRMQEILNSCGPLLTALTYMQRMQLVFYVARLIGLDLGAASLVKESMEPERRAVGDSAIQLIKRLLQQVDGDQGHRKFRRKVEELIVLLEEIKQPRHVDEEKSAQKYKIKMIALMSTAEVALKCCAGVLQGLEQLKEDSQRRLPPKVVAQQVDVLKAIFDAHVDSLSKDGSLRQHIIDCQRRTGARRIISKDYFTTSRIELPKLKDMQQSIFDAVRDAGGFLRLTAPPRMKLAKARATLEGQTEEPIIQDSEQRKPSSHTPLYEGFAEAVTLSSDATTSTPHEEVEEMHSPPARVPLWRPDRPPGQGAGPVRQQLHTLGSSWSPQDQLPQLASPSVSLPEPHLSTYRPQAPTTGVVDTHPYLSPPQIFFPRPSQPPDMHYTARPPHSVSSQQAYAGRSAAAPFVPPSPLRRVDVGGLSQRLQLPGPFQEEAYSHFTDGDTSNRLSFPQEKWSGQYERLMEVWGPKPPEKNFVGTVQSSHYAATAAARTGTEATGPPLAGVPLWWPDWPPRQGAGPVRQQLHTLSSSWSPQDQLPQLLPPQVFPPGSSLLTVSSQAPTSQAPTRGVSVTHSYFSPPQMPFARPPQPSGVQQTGRPPHSASSRQTYAGRSAAGPLVSPPPLPRVGVGEPSQRLQPPAPPQQEGYSLFGGGGIPPWLPFSQASPASIEGRSRASDGRPQEGEGTQRGMRNGQDEAGDSLWSGGNWSGCQ
ncbi:hypothetical protein ETH_00018550 [Eimeria tenella]|uniref:Uncharacterized protein n=1 Tax=Eimeria tenella TaxID=5802 RepID=C8TDV9_EIMTE|nr:hypothetical protein ETH_00018550 [Eimeria tenella]CAK51445.1 hypothetical protein e2017b09.tmp0101 [Eimeria tenella]CDJ42451.1 hypothetical protein ETH_00018550 [Eimeria tenella]|eukprot:XP_013233201.1 hypothetical protein ETH_00018550 [Eimeria tenella]